MDPSTYILPDQFWAGTEHSLDVYRQAYAQIDARLAAGYMEPDEDEEDEPPYLYQQEGNVAIIKIHGSLVNRQSYLNRYYGITAYADIREAMIYAAEQTGVEAIVLDINSGGGAVAGVHDTSALIGRINSQVKPVYTISDGTMASAAYWLGSSARRVWIAPTTLAGSIGTMMVHTEYSKARAEAGVTDTVLRVGKYKALLNPLEPMTDTAKAQAMAHMTAANDLFVSHVAAARQKSVEVVDQTMGQGREFMGAQALAVGLVDAIASFDDAFQSILASLLDKPVVTQAQFGRNVENPMKRTFTAQQAAAIAAGADPAQFLAETQTGAQAEGTQPPATPAVETPPAQAAAPAAAAPAAEPSAVALLQAQLAAAQTTITDLTVKLANASASLTAAQAAQEGLAQIAAGSIGTMRVALSLSAIDLSAMTADTLVAEHKALRAQFDASFKAGGVAVSGAAAAAQEQKAAPVNNARHMAAVRATTFTKA